MTPEPEWMPDALCRKLRAMDLITLDTMFPTTPKGDAEGKAVCGSCRVKGKCLDYAIDNEEKYGIFGGMTPGERGQEAKKRRRKAG